MTTFDLTGGASSQPNLMDFLTGYGRYRKKMGAEIDPLLARSGSNMSGDALRNALQVNQRAGSKRKGQVFLPVHIGGELYHVYYGPRGGRKVIRVGGHAINQPDTIGTGL